MQNRWPRAPSRCGKKNAISEAIKNTDLLERSSSAKDPLTWSQELPELQQIRTARQQIESAGSDSDYYKTHFCSRAWHPETSGDQKSAPWFACRMILPASTASDRAQEPPGSEPRPRCPPTRPASRRLSSRSDISAASPTAGITSQLRMSKRAGKPETTNRFHAPEL